ncbi:MAG: exodeoxyribonuclease I [Gammaproteobacteria bacterium]|nr:exodeoxyribonuclease I [Gammaproteobacteria bacterium]
MGKTKISLYWHDYETFGTDPVRDRPAQFAGIRTDEELNIIGDPLSIYCKPADDVLPQPEACLVTGITPQVALEKGEIESEFIARIHEQLSVPGTCGVGYNSVRFDDEVTRNTLYRNFYDPYAREWQNNNSRWDIIDMVRLTYALRPEGIEWPTREEGKPSFRLDQLTIANGIEHEAAHDAMSDVYATIEMAKLIKRLQPRLYQYVFEHRFKRMVSQQLNIKEMKPVLHVSGMYPGEVGCLAMVVPLMQHPTNQNEIAVYDLRYDPAPLLELDAEQIQERLFTPTSELPEGVERMPLKTVRINKCPVIVPLNTMDDRAAERLSISVSDSQGHLEKIKRAIDAGLDLAGKLRQVFSDRVYDEISDPDLSLYSGGFFSNADRNTMQQLHSLTPEELGKSAPIFEDSRLPEMLFRYRARNFPQTLSSDEHDRWAEYRKERLTQSDGGGSLTLEEYMKRVKELLSQPELTERDQSVLNELVAYGNQMENSLD